MKNLSKVIDYQGVKIQIPVNENVKNIIHFSEISPVHCVKSKTSSQIPRLILLNCQVSKLSRRTMTVIFKFCLKIVRLFFPLEYIKEV